MSELHRIPKKQLDSDLVASSDDMSKIDGLDHTTAEVKSAVDAVGEMTATPEEIDAAAEFVSDISSTPAQVDAAVSSSGNLRTWQVIPASFYTATPASISRITMSNTSMLWVGAPVRYQYGGYHYYGVVASIATNTRIDVAGAPLDTGADLTELAFGDSARVVQVDFFVSSTYADDTNDALLDSDMNTAFSWMGPQAYLVAFKVKNKTDDSGTAPQVNVLINGSAVGTENSGNGPSVSTSWAYTTYTAIDDDWYGIYKDYSVEIACKAAGGAGDAENLTVACLFVLE